MEAGGDAARTLKPAEAEEWAEYQYRRLIPMSHEDYEREPLGKIEWTLRLHNMEEQAKERARRRDAAK